MWDGCLLDQLEVYHDGPDLAAVLLLLAGSVRVTSRNRESGMYI